MKMNQVTSKAYIGKPDAPSTSYVLVNYAEGNAKPVTYKVSIHELGQAIAADLKLYAHNDHMDAAQYYIGDTNNQGYSVQPFYHTCSTLDLLGHNNDPDPDTFYSCFVNEKGQLAYIYGSQGIYLDYPVAFYMKDPESSDIILMSASGTPMTRIPFEEPNLPPESSEPESSEPELNPSDPIESEE